ncbi:MAG: glycosyltransferase [Gammaproteobacteria bacterium]|nr:glycosyltransferase [Gammaproteobacteria bacterium]
METSRPHRTLSVVVPTFREAANIPALAERLDEALGENGIEWELLLVDDDSNDGSEAIAQELAQRLPVRMAMRREASRDLSLSVLQGIRLARFDRLVVMDADLSHPPERIIDLLRALEEDGCDLALGSRYATGGTLDRAWSPWRFLTSRLPTVLAQPLTHCADPMSGFFATDRRRLPDLEQLRPIGYKIALEFMVRGGLQVKEVPIGFSERATGTSKMNARQWINTVRHLHRLYRHRFGGWARLLWFAAVGTSGFLVDVLFYLGLQWAGVNHQVARALAGIGRSIAASPSGNTRAARPPGSGPNLSPSA